MWADGKYDGARAWLCLEYVTGVCMVSVCEMCKKDTEYMGHVVLSPNIDNQIREERIRGANLYVAFKPPLNPPL